MNPRQMLEIAVRTAVLALRRSAELPAVIGPLQDAIVDVSCELLVTTTDKYDDEESTTR